MSRRKTDIIAGLISILVAVIFIIAGLDIHLKANRFPFVLECVLIISGLVLLARGIFSKQDVVQANSEEIVWIRAIVIIVASIVYVFGVIYIGFYVSSLVYLILGSWYLNEHGFKFRPFILSLVFGLALTIVLYGTFNLFLQVVTPSGILF